MSTYRLSFIIAAQSGAAERAIDAMDNAFEFDVAGGDFFGNGRKTHNPAAVMIRNQWSLEAASAALR